MTAFARRALAVLVLRLAVVLGGRRRPAMVLCPHPGCGAANDPERGSRLCFTCHRPLDGSSC